MTARRLAVPVLWFVLGGMAFGEDGSPAATLRANLTGISQEGLAANEAQLRTLADELDPSVRTALYTEFAKPVWATLANVIPGHGLGSFFQKDYFAAAGLLVGGFVVDGIGAVGAGSFVLGIVLISSSMDGPAPAATGDYLRLGSQMLLVAAVGEVTLMALGITRGLSYSLSYNAALSRVLQPQEK